jgi:DNA-binding transcriptional ArsR family regulator
VAVDDSDALTMDLLQDVAGTFGLLSATARVHIMYLLGQEEADVGTLAEKLDQAVPAVSHHLAKLKLAGLVHARREGKRQVYAVSDPRVVEIVRQAVSHHLQAGGGFERGRRRSHGA